VHILVIPGGFGRDWGSNKKISRLANARHNPPTQISNVYPAAQVALGCTPVPAAF